MASQWYSTQAGKNEGPVSSQQLKQLTGCGHLQPPDYVWTQGMPKWVPAKSIKNWVVARRPVTGTPLAKITPAMPAEIPAVKKEHQAGSAAPTQGGKPNKTLVACAIGAGAMGALVVLATLVIAANKGQGAQDKLTDQQQAQADPPKVVKEAKEPPAKLDPAKDEKGPPAKAGPAVPKPFTHTDVVRSVAFSPNGKILASGSADQTVKLWDTVMGQELRTLSGHGQTVSAVAFSPDGTTLASGSQDNTIKLWDVPTGKQRITLALGTGNSVEAVAFSPDGKTLASAASTTIMLWDVRTGEKRRTIRSQGGVSSVAFSPNGKTLASGWYNGAIRYWDVETGRERLLAAPGKRVNSIAYSPDGKMLASGHNDGTIWLWAAETKTRKHEFKGHSGESERPGVLSLAFSPNGKILASGSADQTVKLWDIGSRTNRGTLKGQTETVDCIAFSPDGKTLASAGEAKVRLWDVYTGGEAAMGPDKAPATPTKEKRLPLRERLADTKWVNTNKATFEWDSKGNLLHNGKPRVYEVLEETPNVQPRINVIFSKTNVALLTFDTKLTTFSQSDGSGRFLFTGKRLSPAGSR
jgi:WD40 repeat protein